VLISNNVLRLSYRTIPISTFKIIQNLHLLEVVVFQKKSYWEDPKRRKQISQMFGPLFSSFCTKSPKIWQQVCPAAPLFVWPLLSSAAEQSAS
jgi:hypothetical protein